MLAEYKKRRDWLIPALQKIEGFKCEMPEGAFYAFVDVRGLLGEKFKTSADVADYLLNEAQVVVNRRQRFRRGRIFAFFLRDFDGKSANGGRKNEKSYSIRILNQ